MFSLLLGHPFASVTLAVLLSLPHAFVDSANTVGTESWPMRTALQLLTLFAFNGLISDFALWSYEHPFAFLLLLCVGLRYVHVMKKAQESAASRETTRSSTDASSRSSSSSSTSSSSSSSSTSSFMTRFLAPPPPSVSMRHTKIWGEPYISIKNSRVTQQDIEAGAEVHFYIQPLSSTQGPLAGIEYLRRLEVEASCGGVEIVPAVRYVIMLSSDIIVDSFTAEDLEEEAKAHQDNSSSSSSSSSPSSSSSSSSTQPSSSSSSAPLTKASQVNALLFQFAPKKVGQLQFHVRINPVTDEERSGPTVLRGSPFTFNVVAGIYPHPKYTTVSITKCVEPVGTAFRTTIECADQFGNPITQRLPEWIVSRFSFLPEAWYGQASQQTWTAEFHSVPDSGNVVLIILPTTQGTLTFSVGLEDEPLLLDMSSTGQMSVSALTVDRHAQLLRDIQKPATTFRVRQLVTAAHKVLEGIDVSFSPVRRELRLSSAYAWTLGLLSKQLDSFRLGRGMCIRLGRPLELSLVISRDETLELAFSNELEKQMFHCTFLSLLTWRGRSWEERRNELKSVFQREHPQPASPAAVKLTVDRQDLVRSSMTAFGPLSDDSWRQPWSVSFKNEVGLDAGGLTAELFTVLSKELFSLIFFPFSRATAEVPSTSSSSSSSSASSSSSSSSSSSTSASMSKHRGEFSVVRVFPNAHTGLDEDYFVFAGKLCGKALWDFQMYKKKVHLPVHFTTAFYKQMLQLRTHYTDFAIDDPSILSILDVEVTDDSYIEFFVDVFRPNGDLVESVALRPPPCPVTEQNKLEYLKAVADYRFTKGVKKELDAFLRGFTYVLGPKILDHLSDNFSEIELELLLCGENKIDLSEWRIKENIRYFGCEHNDQIIKWFFNIVENMTNPELCLLLQFVTGSSQIPLGGFSKYDPKFSIHVDRNLKRTALPIAHTCFTQIVLPDYQSFETFQHRLMLAITECSVGFEIK